MSVAACKVIARVSLVVVVTSLLLIGFLEWRGWWHDQWWLITPAFLGSIGWLGTRTQAQ